MANERGAGVEVGKNGVKAFTVDNVIHMDLRGTPPADPKAITNWILAKSPIDSLFRKTKKPIGEVMIEAAKQANINVYYIAAHAALETGWGTSRIARDKMNFFGIGAFDSSAYSSALGFGGGGVEGGIIAGAVWISKNYINNTTYNQNTLYKMRHNNGTHQYATDKEWHTKIASTIVMSPMNPNAAVYDEVANPITYVDGIESGSSEHELIYNGEEIVGPGGIYDGETFEGISGIYDKPSFVPQNYYEDDFQELTHRYTQGDYFMRIGDARFVVPPTRIKISENTNIAKFHSIRQKQSMKVQAGNRMKTIEMSLMFTDFNQINGFEMHGPDHAKSGIYYMDGLRSLIAQMKTMPFLPVENEYLNFTHQIYAVALLSCHVSVVEGFPGMLKADLSMIEFDPEPFLNKPAYMYDMHFIWPLFRWHYQRLLNGRTKHSDVLAPFIGEMGGEDALEFWYLKQEALNDHEDEMHIADWSKQEGEKDVTWWDINAKLDAAKFTNKMFQRHDIPPDYRIVDISGSFGNTFTPLTPSLTGKPTFQYFGSQDARFSVLIHTENREVISSFVALKEQVDRYTREYREGFVSSMLRVNNNFINMMGVSSVLLETMDIETIEGSPGAFYIALNLLSFDETQHADEKLGLLDTVDMAQIMKDGKVNRSEAKKLAGELEGADLASFDNNISHAAAAEMLMNELELYPDLELPTYKEVNEIVKTINTWRKAHKVDPLPFTELIGPAGAVYVDPDFYFSYPSITELIDKMKECLSDPVVTELSADVGIQIDDDYIKSIKGVDLKEYFGKKMISQIEKSPDGAKLKEAYEDLGFDQVAQQNGTIAARWNKIRSEITDPLKYTRRYWIKAWSGEGGSWRKRSQDIEDGTDSDWKIAYYSKQQAEASVKLLSQEDHFNGMMHDMIKYDRRGTMMRAFPTYVLVIIDEGRMINVRKLWDNYYTYHSLSELSIHMSRKSPIHTAYLKLSNVYGALNTKGTYHHRLKTPGFMDMVDSFLDSFVSNVTEKEIAERAIIYNSIQLMAGARIHIRLGYGACASQLPPVFNGVITEIDTGDMVTVVAQSFGYELTNEVGAKPGEENSMFEQGLEATELFRYYMTERRSSYTWAWRNSADPENYQSAYGIEHFGFLRVRDNQNLTDIFNSWYWDHEKEINAEDYDIMKNVYSSGSYNKLGVDEDGIPLFDDEQHMRSLINKENTPYLHKYFDKKNVDLSSMKIDFWGKTLKHVTGEVRAEFVFREIHKKKYNDKQREEMLKAVYIWAANDFTEFYKRGLQLSGYLSGLIKDKDLEAKAEKTLKAMANEFQWLIKEAEKEEKAINEAYEKHKDETEQGELNVRMQLEGKAPWDIFRTLERINPEYVVYPHIHQFGYTLFFGKPWWDVQCAYVLPPVKRRPKNYGKKISDYVELTKPFSQMHFYTSYGDIINNGIKAVGSDLVTAVVPVFQMGSKDEAYEIIWADYYMRGSFQKIRTIDTTLVQNVPWFPNWIEKGWTKMMNLFDSQTKYQKYAVKFAQNVIAESFRDMYQGDLVVFGDPTAKPYDVMYIDDFYTKMSGTAEMGVVVHHLSVETGFITTIKPDLCVVLNPKPDEISETWQTNPAITSGNFFRYSAIAAEFPLQAFRLYFMYKIAQFAFDSNRLTSLAKVARFVQANRTIMPRAISWVFPLASNIAKGIRYVNTVHGPAIPGAIKAIRTVRTVTTGIRAATLALVPVGAATGPPGWVATAVAVASVFATTFLLEALEEMFIQKYNNVVKIFPLFLHEKPFVAGINGHKQLIPGWEDNGSGKAQRVEYNNMPAKPPKVLASQSAGSKGAPSMNNAALVSAATSGGVTYARPHEWLKEMSSQSISNSMFCPPLEMNKGETNWAGFKARSRSENRYMTNSRPDHMGIDLVAKGSNNKFVAFAAGTVMYAGKVFEDSFGTLIILRHVLKNKAGGELVFFTTYGHANKSTMKVSTGETVVPGQVLATMGNEGASKGAHLHFEIHMPQPRSKPKALKLKPGIDAAYWVYAGKKPNRTNIVYEDPLAFIESIISYDSKLVGYKEYKG